MTVIIGTNHSQTCNDWQLEAEENGGRHYDSNYLSRKGVPIKSLIEHCQCVCHLKGVHEGKPK
jgi:hypothetical protein